MEVKIQDEIKPKISRSRARHLRRKRLNIARKVTETGTSTNTKITIDNNLEKVTNQQSLSQVQSYCEKCASSTLTNLSFENSIPSNSSSTQSEYLHTECEKRHQILIKSVENQRNQLESELILNNPPNNNKIFVNEVFHHEVKSAIIHKGKTVGDAEEIVNENQKTVLQKLIVNNTERINMNSEGKSREQIKAERDAKKAAKAALKNKGKNVKQAESVIEPRVTVKATEKSEIKKKSVQGPLESSEIAAEKSKNLDENVSKVVENLSTMSMNDSNEKSKQQGDKTDGKNKSELRAERRAKQEAQRAAKLQQEKTKTPTVVKPVNASKPTNDTKKQDLDNREVQKITQPTKKSATKDTEHEISLFKHLYQEREQAILNKSRVNSNIHPAIVRLGVQYENKVIVGSNARCIALLAAVKELVQDFERPSQADFTRGFEASLHESSTYLHHCRPFAVSMQNALRHLKWKMSQFSTTISDNEAKTNLIMAIDTYIQEQILLADQAISDRIQTKISEGDVILTYGYSSLIQKILCDAHKAKIQFRVIIVDGRPWLEGKELLRRLSKAGIECSYVLINALSFIMPEVSKVFLGAHAILANGAVMSRAGTAQVALMAKAFNVPVLVACETHKSCERVQTDSIVYNEIGNADELTEIPDSTKKISPLANWKAKKCLNLLNITYDVTPADFVTAVVTELAILPCTSVPVILRIKPSEI